MITQLMEQDMTGCLYLYPHRTLGPVQLYWHPLIANAWMLELIIHKYSLPFVIGASSAGLCAGLHCHCICEDQTLRQSMSEQQERRKTSRGKCR